MRECSGPRVHGDTGSGSKDAQPQHTQQGGSLHETCLAGIFHAKRCLPAGHEKCSSISKLSHKANQALQRGTGVQPAEGHKSAEQHMPSRRPSCGLDGCAAGVRNKCMRPATDSMQPLPHVSTQSAKSQAITYHSQREEHGPIHMCRGTPKHW